jgi:N-acetylglutamate synthase-like GNAT family acetyltransferase
VRSIVLNIRRVQSSDLEDVNEISKHIWDGHDYVPSVAKAWLKDPTCHFYGVEEDGRVVAVGNLRLIENGRVGWMEGLRVHPDYRGRGLANELSWYIVKKGEELGVKRLRYTTNFDNVASLRLAKKLGFKRVITVAVAWLNRPKPGSAPRGYPQIEKLEAKKVWSLLDADSRLVPRGILFYDWKALDLGCENLLEIGKTHEFYAALKNERMNSLSFGLARREANRPWGSFTICASGRQGFLAQLSCWAEIALEQGFNLFACTFQPRFEKTVKARVSGPEEYDGTRMILLEKQVRCGSDISEPHKGDRSLTDNNRLLP